MNTVTIETKKQLDEICFQLINLSPSEKCEDNFIFNLEEVLFSTPLQIKIDLSSGSVKTSYFHFYCNETSTLIFTYDYDSSIIIEQSEGNFIRIS